MKKQIKKIKIRGKIIEAEVCDTPLARARGLMFRKKSKPLLFVFKESKRRSIHSFFCSSFKAIWMLNKKVVNEKIVKPFSLSIKPKEKFNRLLEIPLKNNNMLFRNSRRE